MILAVTIALIFTFGATLMPNAAEESFIEDWKYDRESRQKILHEKLSKALAKGDANHEKPCTASNWSLENFIERYLNETHHHSLYMPPDDRIVDNLMENNEEALFHPYVFENYFKKYEIHDDKELKTPEDWTFTDFIEKYEATTVWERIKQEALIVGRNDTGDRKFFSLTKGLDSTDELLGLEVPRSGRRWWNSQWQVPQPPHESSLAKGDLETVMHFMKQAIYHARNRMRVMQELREEYRMTALYKMGYLFAKTDYAVILLSSINIESLSATKQTRKIGRASKNAKTTKNTNTQYPPKNPFNIDKYKIKDRNKNPAGEYETLDVTSEEEVSIKESLDVVKKYQLETNANVISKTSIKSFYEKYGTLPPVNKNTKSAFKDFLEKYALTTVWDQIDKERIVTGKNITRCKEMVSLVKGIDNTDELLSLQVENGRAKLPVQAARRFRAGKHNLDGNMFQFNYMHVHQYIIELMKQAIYQARNRMTFMQALRNRHRRSGLYKMGFLFAKADQAGKTFSSLSQKSFRMCNMIRQGFMGVYRPYHGYIDIAYALERMETKWFDVDLLSDLIVSNDNIVRYQIFTNRSLKSPRDLAGTFDKLFIE